MNDLQDLVEYIAKSAPLAARRFGQRVLDRVDLLAEHPLSGAVIPEDETGTYREVLQGNYRIIYRFDGQNIFVVAIHHGARLLDAGNLT